MSRLGRACLLLLAACGRTLTYQPATAPPPPPPPPEKVPRSTLVPGMNLPTSPPTKVFTRPGLEVVGAGVSTCAPVMP